MARTHSNRGWPDGKRMIRSFEENRICMADGCGTKLSRYNPDECCSIHRDRISERPPERGHPQR